MILDFLLISKAKLINFSLRFGFRKVHDLAKEQLIKAL